MIFPWRQVVGALISLLATVASPIASAAASPGEDAAAVRQRFADAPVWVVGERHRVAAGHRLFGALVTQVLEAGEAVGVGLEIPSDWQGNLDAALLGGDRAVAPVVIDCPSYRGLLARLGVLSVAYPGRLAVRAIDAPSGVSKDRDRHMAEALAHMRSDGQRLLALVGNLHALKGAPGGAGGAPRQLAARLEASGVEVASLLQLGRGQAPPGRSSGVLVATAGPGATAMRELARSVEGALGAPPRGYTADAVILRP